MDAVLSEYEEGAKEVSIEMGVEALPLEEDAEDPNSENDIDSVPT